MVTKNLDTTSSDPNQMPADAFKDLIKHCISMLEVAVSRNDSRFVIRIMRHFKTLRSFLNNHTASSIPILKLHLKGYASGANPCSIAEHAYNALPSDVLPPILAEGTPDQQSQDIATTAREPITHDSRFFEKKVMLLTLSLIFLIDRKEYEKAMELGDKLAHLMMTYNKRIMDYLGAKVYFYYSRAHELGGKFKDVRELLMNSYRKACLHHDPMTQAVTFNCILRNLIHHKLYASAFKLICKTCFPEYLSSNAQYARYLYYFGKVLAVQLEYSESHIKLMQALRKAPQNDKTAYGFKLMVTKVVIVVGLLMCDIPRKSIFTNPTMRKDLIPYESIVIAVRNGELSVFSTLCDRYHKLFEKDDTLFLISRLRNNVIRGGLRKINLAYSKIKLADIAKKLGIESIEHTENVIAKAIHDGIIEAIIDHDQQYVQSKVNTDLYKSYEPMRAFHKRVNFCLKLHSNAIQAMRYPDDVEDEKRENNTSIEKDHLGLVDYEDGMEDHPL